MSIQIPAQLSPERLLQAVQTDERLELSEAHKIYLDKGHAVLTQALARNEQVYGVNTGFGPFVNRSVDEESIHLLQHNLVHQLNAGAGKAITKMQAKAVFLVRINTLAKGYSGVSSTLLETLLAFYHADLIPVIFSYGSVGASGDLVPLSSIARLLQGKGYYYTTESDYEALSEEVLLDRGVSPYVFRPKEALALVNGTSYSEAMTSIAYLQAERFLWEFCLPFTALSMQAFNDSLQSLSPLLYEVKAHDSAALVAMRMRELLQVERPELTPGVPQPPYSSRSAVLWLGACLEQLQHAHRLLEIELNSTDDNPIFDPHTSRIIHGANFQGTYTALAADEISSALVKMAALLDAQLKRVLHESQNAVFPAYLAEEPIGLNSGFQGVQLMITSVLARMKGRFRPQGVESISTNDNNQDVVSMSANAALQAHELVEMFSWMVAGAQLVGRRMTDFMKNEPISNVFTFEFTMNDAYQPLLNALQREWMIMQHKPLKVSV